MEVVLSGQKKLVRKNLAEAIRAIRMTKKIVPIWIDAISINHDDPMERSRQVTRMGSIYRNAMAVFSYVGEQTQDTVDALDLMKELKKHPMIRTNDRGEFHFGEWGHTEGKFWYGENTIKPGQLAELCAALYRFLTRQYFRRAWVLQVYQSQTAFKPDADVHVGGSMGIESHDLGRKSASDSVRKSRCGGIQVSRHVAL
jgi:hypothetical protein